jgi:NADH-quinone oxidoreductase subunit L
VQKVLPETILKENLPAEIIFQLIAMIVMLLGVYTAYNLYYRNRPVIEKWKQSPFKIWLRNFWFRGWAFDQLYETVFVKPFLFITGINKSDVFDRFYNGIATVSQRLNQLFSVSQNGSLRTYVMGVIIGIIFILTLHLLL